jgi:hypothetical protein
MRKVSIAAPLVLAAAVLGAVLFAGCHSPFATGGSSSAAKGAMKVSFQAKSAKTVVADLAATVYRYSVVLSCTSASTSDLSGTLLASQASEGLSFSSILPGTWNVSVVATDESSTQIGVGLVEGVIITAGGSANVTVPISGTKTGTGSFSFSFEWPQASADSVSATLYDSSDNPVEGLSSTEPTTNGSNYKVTASKSGIASGTYRLQLTFTESGVTSGIFGEAVNVWDNVTSNLWLDSSGTCRSMRTFAASEFNSHDASLKGLYATMDGTTAGKLPVDLPSSARLFVEASSATFTPFQSVDGQKIECSTSGGESWTTVASGATTPAVSAGSTIIILVTATDGTSQKTYTITPNTALGSQTFSTPGVYGNTFENPHNVIAKVWGAGGGSSGGAGGGGGYAYSTFSVAAGQAVVIVVGQGGGHARSVPSGVPAVGGFGHASGGGGSLVAVFDGTTYTLEACGGGGGGGAGDGIHGGNSGGTGGGLSGGLESMGYGFGGSGGIGGNGGDGSPGTNMNFTTTIFATWGGTGGTDTTYGLWGGGGGGGYGGGSAPAVGGMCYGGDGGGGYACGTGLVLTSGSGQIAGNNGDADYLAGVGHGADINGTNDSTGGLGGNGEVRVIID